MRDPSTGMRHVGFIGLGRMGWPMASRLGRRADVELFVTDVSAATCERFVAGSDATHASDVAEMIRHVDEVLLCLPGPEAMDAVIDEIATALPDAGRPRPARVLNLSTNGLGASVRAAGTLDAVGADFIDCPVSGGATGAAAGTLTVIVSGPQDAVDACTGLLDTLGTIVNLGERVGVAQVVKAANNFLSLTALALTAEAVEVVRAFGVPLDTQLSVYNASSGANSATRVKYPNEVATGRFDFGFSFRSVLKDLGTFLEAAEAVAESPALARSSYRLWEDACAQGWAESDCTRLEEFLRSRSGRDR